MQSKSRCPARNGRVPVRQDRVVGFAGSRRGEIVGRVAAELVHAFSGMGFRGVVGCADGVDRAFRNAVSDNSLARRFVVHCAFPSRVRKAEALGLKAECRVSGIASAAAALHWRTVLMVRECSLLVLFPDDPRTGTWGKGSRLAFNTAIQDHIPVFVVTAIPPQGTRQFRVKEASLFGVIEGYWVIPQGVEVRNEPA